MANTYLKRTGTTTVNTYTFSAWIKLGTLTVANNTYQVLFSSGNQNILGIYGGATTSGHNALYHYNNTNLWWTNNLLRDPSAWYHVVAKVSGGTVTTYINGVQTSYATSTYSLGALETTADKTCLGCYAPSATSFFRGSMSHVHFISGTAYDPSAFGETDTTTGEWKIKTSPSVTYGADGFFILKDGNSVTDQSGNSNNFTVGGGTLTKTEDNPSNVFATINPLDTATGVIFNLANGNTTLNDNGSSDNDMGIKGTFGVNSGKYYWEMKKGSGSGGVHAVVSEDVNIRTGNRATNPPVTSLWGVQSNGTGSSLVSYYNGTFSSSNALQGYGANDIVGFALDMDNGKLYVSINGVFKGLDNNTSNPANGTNPAFTGLPTDGKFVFPYFEKRSSDSPETMCNFGNGYFGTTAVATNSGNGYAGAEGSSIFNYQPPTGYSSLSTKGLNL